MLDAHNEPLAVGDSVVLLSLPDGYESRHYPLTLGATYEVQAFMGSNVVTTSDEPSLSADYWRGRVAKVS